MVSEDSRSKREESFLTCLSSGDIPGFGTQLLWSADRGIGIVALCNADG